MLQFMHAVHRRCAAALAGTIAIGLGACGSVQPQRTPDAAVPADAADAALPGDVGIHGCAPVALITDVESTDPGYGNACIRGAWRLEALNGTTTPDAVNQPSNAVLVSPVAITSDPNPFNTSSTHAVHVSGEGQHNVGENFAYAELFAALNQPSDTEVGTVDASMYTGIQFYGKLSAGSTGARVTVGNLFTAPAGGMCTPGGANKTDCYDNPGIELVMSTTWKKYEVPFASLTQYGYGYPSPVGPAFPRNAITEVRWDIVVPDTGNTMAWDLWVDDLRFY